MQRLHLNTPYVDLKEASSVVWTKDKNKDIVQSKWHTLSQPTRAELEDLWNQRSSGLVPSHDRKANLLLLPWAATHRFCCRMCLIQV